jgi:DNA gyrase subunit A
MIINKSGITIRLEVDGLRVMGRATQGVKLIRINEGDEISSVEKIEKIVDENNKHENSQESENNEQ